MTLAASPPPPDPYLQLLRSLAGPLLALLIGLGLVAVGVSWVRTIEDQSAQAQFLARCQRITKDIDARVESFFVLARAAAGQVDARSQHDLASWRAYVSRIDPERDWLGFRGMAVAWAVASGKEQAFIAARRRAGQADFHIWHARGAEVAAEFRLPISVMAPQSARNDAIIGFDLAAEPRRAAAARLARDRGLPALSAPLVLLNDDGRRETSLALMSPVYGGEAVDTVASRRTAFRGVVVVGIGIGHLLNAVLDAPDVAGIRLRITDLGDAVPLLPGTATATVPAPRFTTLNTLTKGGREWLLQYDSQPEFEAAIDRGYSELLLAAGVVGAVLLALAVFFQGSLTRRAEQRAREMTGELRASESRFRLVAEAAGEGLWEQDLINGGGFLSPRLVTGILGYPPESFGGGSGLIEDLIHPEDRERWRATRQRHIDKGEPYQLEYRIKCADGSWLWVHSRGKAEFDEHGRALRIAGSLADITERKEHERQLERQQRFLGELLDGLPEAVAVKRPGGEYLIANRAYVERVGLPVAEIIGRRAHDLFPQEVADAAVALDREVATDGQMRQVEQRRPDHRHGGALRDLVATKMLTHGADGEPLIVGIYQDVTELRRSEVRFRELSEMGSDWFWEQDAELRFVELSSGVRSGGRSPVRALGLHRWDLPIDWSAEQRAAHQAVLEAHQPFSGLEYRIRDESGNWHWYSISGRPQLDAGGKFTGYRGTGTDITARKQAEDELRRHRDNLAAMVEERTAQLRLAKEAAEAASHAKSEFLANMSHELRTPLHAILSFAEIGRNRVQTQAADKLAGYFTKIHGAGSRLLHLINDVLDLSKLEAGKMVLSLGSHDLIRLLHEVAAELEALAEAKGQRFDLPPAEMTAMATVDAPRFSQVLRNLLSNAIKFSGEGSCITVEINEATMPRGRRVADQLAKIAAWRVVVIDQGVGIPEDELEAVFDKFVQSSQTRTGAGGTGLGLSISREIVEAHRGLIRAYNHRDEQGSGAVFELLIPR